VHALWWLLIGVLVGMAAMLPVLRQVVRRVEHRARAAERRARDAERLAELGSMTSGLAHEIKNPLSTIGLNAQLLGESLREAELEPGQRDRLRRRLDALSREVERLSGILADFLQFAGRMQLDPQPKDLVEVLDELSDFFMPQCEQAGIRLRTQLPGQPVIVPVDEGLLKQALLNLMINASQAMTSARPEQDLKGDLMLRLDADRDCANVHVIDTGPGIEAERLETVFHPYVSSKPGGTGLGLPTARRIIEEHGGRLTVHSEPGQGSDFMIELPRASARSGTDT
jgi:signal transduction histidine kinase